MQIIDADGHINDHACGEEIAAHMPKGNQMAKPFPGVRSSALSLFETKSARHGQPVAGGLESVSRQDRNQLDGTLSDGRPRGRKNHGTGMGGAGMQSL